MKSLPKFPITGNEPYFWVNTLIQEKEIRKMNTFCCERMRQFETWDEADSMNLVQDFNYCPYCGMELEE